MNTYDVGDKPRVTGTLADVLDVATDPAGTVTAKIRDPSGNTSTYVYGTDAELVKSSTGVYYVDVDLDEEGIWYYRFESGSGVGQAASEGSMRARETAF